MLNTNFFNILFRPFIIGLPSDSNNSNEKQSSNENNSLMHIMCMRRKAEQGIMIDDNNSCSCISFGDEWPL